MADLVVSDEEYNELRQALISFSDAAENRLERYLSIMNATSTTAILGGYIGQRFESFTTDTQALLKETIRILSLTADRSAESFTTEIDEKDNYLY